MSSPADWPRGSSCGCRRRASHRGAGIGAVEAQSLRRPDSRPRRVPGGRPAGRTRGRHPRLRRRRALRRDPAGADGRASPGPTTAVYFQNVPLRKSSIVSSTVKVGPTRAARAARGARRGACRAEQPAARGGDHRAVVFVGYGVTAPEIWATTTTPASTSRARSRSSATTRPSKLPGRDERTTRRRITSSGTPRTTARSACSSCSCRTIRSGSRGTG